MTRPPTASPVGPAADRLAHNLRHLRRQRHLSADRLSERLTVYGRPINRRALSAIEHSQRRCDVDELTALAAVLSVPVPRLLQRPEDCLWCRGRPTTPACADCGAPRPPGGAR